MLEGRGKGILVPSTVARGKGRGGRRWCVGSCSPRSMWKSSLHSFCFLNEGGSGRQLRGRMGKGLTRKLSVHRPRHVMGL